MEWEWKKRRWGVVGGRGDGEESDRGKLGGLRGDKDKVHVEMARRI